MAWQLTGVHGFQAALERAGERARAEVTRINKETAIELRARAQAYAPKDRGDLASAITASGRGMTWRVGLADIRIEGRGGENSAHLNPSVYGVWQEYGFVTRNIKKTPFMRRAVAIALISYRTKLAAAVRPIETASGGLA